MRYSAGRSIYPKTYTIGDAKDTYMRGFLLSNELSRLEYEKKIASIKISALEKRIHDVRNEIQAINYMLKDNKEIIESYEEAASPKKKHVTLEY